MCVKWKSNFCLWRGFGVQIKNNKHCDEKRSMKAQVNLVQAKKQAAWAYQEQRLDCKNEGEGRKAIAIIRVKRQSPCVKKQPLWASQRLLVWTCEQLVQAKKQVVQAKREAVQEILAKIREEWAKNVISMKILISWGHQSWRRLKNEVRKWSAKNDG